MNTPRHRHAPLVLLWLALCALLTYAGSSSSQTVTRTIATLPINLASTAQTTGILPISRGGSGNTTGQVNLSTQSTGTITLPTQVTGVLDVAHGGTGTTSGVSPFTAPGGRLTLTTGTPITTTDVTAASTLYYTASAHGWVPISDGVSLCTLVSFTEASLALSALTSGKNYDVFVKSVAGVATLELSAAWTNDTTRADALARDTICPGVQVKSSAHTRTWVGTLRTTGTTTTEDSLAKRFVWNAYNRTRRSMLRVEATSSWTDTSTSWRQANASASNQFEYVAGDAAAELEVDLRVLTTGSANSESVGIGIDSTTAPSGLTLAVDGFANGVSTTARYSGWPGLGWHKVCWLEIVNAGTGTFYGTNSARNSISGMVGTVMN